MKFKLNKKHLLISLFMVTTLGAISFGLVSSIDNNSKTNTLLTNASSSPIISNKVGQKVGPIRHWQNNNFSGLEVKNGGFVVLTGTDSATRIDSFGNILWEFSPSSLLNSNYQSANIFLGKKVVEIVQDEMNNDVLYLLLVPTQVPNENNGIDQVDPFFYSNLSSNTANQAIVVQITENTYSYNGSNWSPSFVINSHLFINPKSMVDNYPSNWKTLQQSKGTQSTTTQNDFFSKVDHPSWYVTNSGDKVSPAPSTSGSVSRTTQESTVSGTTMVLPWKQYVTNLGNMYASNGNVFIFGGNGSIYNDPEALSIGVWKLNFNTATSTGIPYAYILSGLSYSPSFSSSSSSSTPTKNWDKCYAPIAQTKDFHYVPRLAIGGIQTNVSSNENLFIYLSGAITVGQIKNSQTREWDPNNNNNNNNTTITLQQKRSLQLSGQNIISNPQNPDRNSIDPCLLFGTALNINSLLNMPNTAKQEDFGSFDNILFSNQYFDIGTNMSYNAFAGTYYFFDDKKTSDTTTTTTTTTIQRNNAARRTFPYDFNPTIDTTETTRTQQVFPFGQVEVIREMKHTSGENVEYEGKSKVSYSYNLSLLVDNAKNYYYPTLSFGYSLKSLGSLVKVKMDGQLPENKGKVFYGYAMQVGKSILFINEPKFDSTSIVYRAPSTVSIGNNDTIGQPKYRDDRYYYQFRSWSSNNSFDNLPFSSCGYYLLDNQILALGVTQYVAGIKDFNDTVPEITKQFKISNDPYADAPSAKATSEPTLPWSNFKGLTFANNGESVASSWYNKDTPNNNKLFVTIHPQLTEFSSSLLWSEFFYTYNNNGNGFDTIQNQVWFEDVSSQYNGYSGRDLGTYQSVSQFKGPFLNDPSLQQPDGGFYAASDTNFNSQMNVTLKLRNDSTNVNYIFGQSSSSLLSKNTSNSLSYCTVDDQLMTYKIIPSLDRTNVLGQGQFVDTISNDFLSNSLSSILQTIPISDLTNNPNDNGNVSILKSQFVSNVFKITKQPDTSGLTFQLKHGSVLIVATNIDLLKQSAKLTAYSWNKVLNCYDVMPSSASIFTTVSNSIFSGFSAMAEWILPVAIAAPIGFIALVIGMGCAIGIPMSKHRKSIRVGFELQHEKVSTLTTAVGGVFKKIIDTTSADKMKAKPQMLNSGGPKPAPSPTSPKPNVAPKPANMPPNAPKQFTKSIPPKPNNNSNPSSVNNSAPKPN